MTVIDKKCCRNTVDHNNVLSIIPSCMNIGGNQETQNKRINVSRTTAIKIINDDIPTQAYLRVLSEFISICSL
jgi:hypothetical protein